MSSIPISLEQSLSLVSRAEWVAQISSKAADALMIGMTSIVSDKLLTTYPAGSRALRSVCVRNGLSTGSETVMSVIAVTSCEVTAEEWSCIQSGLRIADQ